MDHAIKKYEPLVVINTNTSLRFYEQWEQSNRLSMMFIKNYNTY